MVATLRRADWGCGDDLLGDESVDAAWELSEDNLTMSDFVSFDYLVDTTNDRIPVFFGTSRWCA
jgi:hypothetical protein